MEVLIEKDLDDINVWKSNFMTGEYENISEKSEITIKGNNFTIKFTLYELSYGSNNFEISHDHEDKKDSRECDCELNLHVKHLDTDIETSARNTIDGPIKVAGPVLVEANIKSKCDSWKTIVRINRPESTDIYDALQNEKTTDEKSDKPDDSSESEEYESSSSSDDSDDSSSYNSDGDDYRYVVPLSACDRCTLYSLRESMQMLHVMGATFITGTLLIMLASIVFR